MDQEITSKEKVLDCIRTTNKVINGWIKDNNIHPDKITQQDVISIFKGSVKTKLISYLPDFKRASKSLRVDIDRSNNNFIKSVYIMYDGYSCGRMNNKIEQVSDIISKLTKEDYDNCCIFNESEKRTTAPPPQNFSTAFCLLHQLFYLGLQHQYLNCHCL